MKQKVKIMSYGELKKMGKIPLTIENPKNKSMASNERYLNLYNYHEDDVPVAYIDGDLDIDGNFDLDELFEKLFIGHEKGFDFPDKGYRYTAISVIWITGNLNVSNSIISDDYENMSQILVVEKNVTTKNIIQGGVEFFFLKNLRVNQIKFSRGAAEGGHVVFGEEESKISVDVNFYWKIGDNPSIEIDDDEESLKLVRKIFFTPFIYFNEACFEEDYDYDAAEEDAEDADDFGIFRENKFIEDLINNKNIFKDINMLCSQ